jgi:hypothetical protein
MEPEIELAAGKKQVVISNCSKGFNDDDPKILENIFFDFFF